MWRKWHVFESEHNGRTVISANHNGLATVRKIANRQFDSRQVIGVGVGIGIGVGVGVAGFIKAMYSRR